MADDNHGEVNRLRGLVVKLAKEIDYKNHLLMEKEGLSLEKFATMTCLMEEKDRLLAERSEVIGSLMAQKFRLHEAYIEGMQNFEDVKLELKKAKHDLEVEKSKKNQSMELVKYQADTNEGLAAVTTNCLSIRDKVNEQSEAMIKTAEDKQRPLKQLEKGAVLTGKRKIQCRKQPFEKLCYLCTEPPSKLEELEKQTKLLQDRNDNLSIIMIKTESIDYDFGSPPYPVEPLRKKFKDSKSQNAKEQTSSVMEKGKAICGGRDEVPKEEV